MKKGLEVKNIVFRELRRISSEEFYDSVGMNIPWDGFMDGADVKLVLANSSKETKKPYIHIVARPDILTTEFQSGLQTDVDVKPGEEKEAIYVVPIIAISSSDYRDYTGPWRCAMEVTVYDSYQGEVLFKKVKYYDIPAKIQADELEEGKFDIQEALRDLEKTTVLHDFHLEGSPKGNVKSIKAKLFNFGENTQYIGIDMRAERRRAENDHWSYGTQLFYEIEPKEKVLVDIDPGSALPAEVSPESLTGMEYLRIRASSIPEPVFLSQKGRLWFLSKSYEDEENYKTLIAKFEFYFKESEV